MLQVVATLNSPTNQPIRALQHSPHRKHQLATIGDQGVRVGDIGIGLMTAVVQRLVLWDSTELNVIASFDAHSAPACRSVQCHLTHWSSRVSLCSVHFSPLNKLLLASAGLDRKILFYDSNDRKVHPLPRNLRSGMYDILCINCPVTALRLKNSVCKVIKSIDAEAPLTGMSFLDDGVMVAAGTTSGLVLIYDLRRGAAPLMRINAHPGEPVSYVYLVYQLKETNGL